MLSSSSSSGSYNFFPFNTRISLVSFNYRLNSFVSLLLFWLGGTDYMILTISCSFTSFHFNSLGILTKKNQQQQVTKPEHIVSSKGISVFVNFIVRTFYIKWKRVLYCNTIRDVLKLTIIIYIIARTKKK